MGQRWETGPWRLYWVSYMNGDGEYIEQTVLARDMGEAAVVSPSMTGLCISPGPYAEREPE